MGFHRGLNRSVALSSKLIILALVIWAISDPEYAGNVLNKIQTWTFYNLQHYYNWAVGFFILVCLFVSIHPKWGKLKLGDANGKPEFSNFSWFAMMFSAGIGIGMLGFATGEPISFMDDNPAIRISEIEINQALQSANLNIPSKEKLWDSYHANVASGSLDAIPDLVEPRTLSAVKHV